MSKLLTHWESFRVNMLPQLRSVFGLKLDESYDQSLELYKEPGLYEFMATPFGELCQTVGLQLMTMGLPQREAHAQMRVMIEESYAVMTFQQQGCRVIRPTADLVAELLNTDTHFKLTDIRPPWPHVYIEMPTNLGLKLSDFYTGVPRDISGFYATWTETGAETRAAYTAEVARLREAGQPIDSAISMYGDWCARFVAHTVDQTPRKGSMHNQTVRFFNMHWQAPCAWTCEQAYPEVRKIWGGKMTDDDDRFQETLFRLTVNLFAYMALPQSQRDVIWKPDPDRERLRNAGTSWNSKRRRNLRNRLRDEMRVEAWEVGQTITIQRRSAKERDLDATTGEVTRHVRTHWRRGHINNYWLGKRDTPERHLEPRYIRPTLIIGRGEAPAQTTVVVK